MLAHAHNSGAQVSPRGDARPGRREPGELSAHGPVDDPVVTARALTKVFGRGESAVTALDAVDVHLARGRFTAVMGPSGSGKSTLMHCLAGLESPTSGTITLDGEEISSMSRRRLTRLRRENIGFVFQAFNLVPSLSAEENITLPLDIARRKVERSRFDQVVEAVGLSDRLSHRPAELSGGQVQRTACARSLVGRPAVVFADEPTAALDVAAAAAVLDWLAELAAEGAAVLMVTHDATAAARAGRVLVMDAGRVVGQLPGGDPAAVSDAVLSARAGDGHRYCVYCSPTCAATPARGRGPA